MVLELIAFRVSIVAQFLGLFIHYHADYTQTCSSSFKKLFSIQRLQTPKVSSRLLSVRWEGVDHQNFKPIFLKIIWMLSYLLHGESFGLIDIQFLILGTEHFRNWLTRLQQGKTINLQAMATKNTIGHLLVQKFSAICSVALGEGQDKKINPKDNPPFPLQILQCHLSSR